MLRELDNEFCKNLQHSMTRENPKINDRGEFFVEIFWQTVYVLIT